MTYKIWVLKNEKGDNRELVWMDENPEENFDLIFNSEFSHPATSNASNANNNTRKFTAYEMIIPSKDTKNSTSSKGIDSIDIGLTH